MMITKELLTARPATDLDRICQMPAGQCIPGCFGGIQESTTFLAVTGLIVRIC